MFAVVFCLRSYSPSLFQVQQKVYDWRSDIGNSAMDAVKKFLADEEQFDSDADRVNYLHWATSKNHKYPFVMQWHDEEMVRLFFYNIQ